MLVALKDAGATDRPDMILTASYAVPGDKKPPVRDASIVVSGGRIAAVGTQADHASLARLAITCRRFEDAVILPGLVNAHSHLEYTLAGPATTLRDFPAWLSDLARQSRQVPGQQWQASSRHGAALMLKAGITSVGDIMTRGHSVHAIAGAGLHGNVYVEYTGGHQAGWEDQLRGLARRVGDAARSAGPPGQSGIRLGISPHAPYSVSASAARAVLKLAHENDWPIATHLAESAAEIDFLAHGTGEIAEETKILLSDIAPGWRGGDPLAYAASSGYLSAGRDEPRPLLIHCTRLPVSDVSRLAAAKVAAVLCPRSNAMLSNGEPPVAALAACGIPLGIGTDSLASNASLDLFPELRLLRDIWHRQDPSAAPAAIDSRLLAMATAEGADALGLLDQIGTITPGKRADFTVVELPPDLADQPHRLISAIINHAQAGSVIATFTDGMCRYHRDRDGTNAHPGAGGGEGA